jgi:hypothetical protein
VCVTRRQAGCSGLSLYWLCWKFDLIGSFNFCE